jgi:uncharacterized protein YecT (DUF1311 family)
MRPTVAFAVLIVLSALLTPVANSQSPAPMPLTPAQSTTATGNDERIVPRGNEKPSFDCAQAKTAAARLICADAELARLDGELGAAFQKRKAQISAPDQSKFVTEQLAWIRDRNERCDVVGKNGAPIEVLVGSKSCMMSLIRERIAFLAQTDSTGSASTARQPPPIPAAEPLHAPDAVVAARGNTGTTVPPLKWANAGEDGVCLYPQPQCVVVPAEQKELSSILSRFNVLSNNAPNDIQREKLEPAFRKEFCAKIPQGDVSGWIGEVRSIDNRTPSKVWILLYMLTPSPLRVNLRWAMITRTALTLTIRNRIHLQ